MNYACENRRSGLGAALGLYASRFLCPRSQTGPRGHSYDRAFGLSSIFLLNGRAAICAPFCGKCTNATMSKDFETYIISDILQRFRIDKVGLIAFFTQLIGLLKRHDSFEDPSLFWDCALITQALKPPLSRAGLFTGLHKIRRFAPEGVRWNLLSVLGYTPEGQDWRQHIFQNEHPLLKKVLTYILDKFLGDKGDEGGGSHATDKKYGQYHGNLYSLSIFPRQINEHGKPKVKDIFFVSSVFNILFV